MKTNIVRLPKGNFGKLVGNAIYCCAGCCAEDAEYDIADIYQLLDGSLIAEAYGVLFPIKQTNWKPGQLNYHNNDRIKRGRHSRIAYEKRRIKIKPVEIEELPF